MSEEGQTVATDPPAEEEASERTEDSEGAEAKGEASADVTKCMKYKRRKRA